MIKTHIQRTVKFSRHPTHFFSQAMSLWGVYYTSTEDQHKSCIYIAALQPKTNSYMNLYPIHSTIKKIYVLSSMSVERDRSYAFVVPVINNITNMLFQ